MEQQSQGSEPGTGETSGPEMPPASGGGVTLPAPPTSFGRQMMQLVLIPLLIVTVIVVIFLAISWMAPPGGSIEDDLKRLSQGGGAGRMAGGFNDPRHQERYRAAESLAYKLGKVTDPQKRKDITKALIEILRDATPEYVAKGRSEGRGTEEEKKKDAADAQSEDALLQQYLILAIGKLEQEDGFNEIQKFVVSRHDQVRVAAVLVMGTWPDMEVGRRAVPIFRRMLNDPSPQVALPAATALANLAQPEDAETIQALHEALSTTQAEYRQVRWNAAVALARLGDDRGSEVVAGLLLNRDELAKLPADIQGPNASRPMPRPMQDVVIMLVLQGAEGMPHPAVWERIRQLAANDTSLAVKIEAQKLLDKHKHQEQHKGK